jgi:hypothetical protein
MIRAVLQEQPIGQHEERAGPLLDDRGKSRVDLFLRPHAQGQHFHSQHLGRGLRLLLGDDLERAGRIPEHGDVRDVGDHFPEQLQPLPVQFG